MNKKLKVISLVLASVLLLAVLGWGGYFVIKNAGVILSGSEIYSDKDITEAYAGGYNDGLGNYTELLSIAGELETEVNQVRAELIIKQAALDDAAEALLNSNLTLEQKQQLITELENDIYDLGVYIELLDEQLADALEEVERLTEENSNLSLQITNMTAELQEAQETISGFAVIVEQYEQVIDDLINGAAYNFLVTFIYNDFPTVIYGGYYDIEYEYPVFESTAHAVFNGWSLDGETLITDTTFSIVAGTVLQDNKVTFIALVDRYIDITFINGNTELSTTTYPLGITFANVTKPIIEDTNRVRFNGWSLDGRNLYVSNSTPLNYSQVFKVMFEYYQRVDLVRDFPSYNVITIYVLLNSKFPISALSLIPDVPNYPIIGYKLWTAGSSGDDFVNLEYFIVTRDEVIYIVYPDIHTGHYLLYYKNPSSHDPSPDGLFGSLIFDSDGTLTFFTIFENSILGDWNPSSGWFNLTIFSGFNVWGVLDFNSIPFETMSFFDYYSLPFASPYESNTSYVAIEINGLTHYHKIMIKKASW